MNKPIWRRNSARLIVVLLGLGGLTSCNSCSQSEVRQTQDRVTEVLDRLSRLDSICADDVRVEQAGNMLRFIPAVRNPREPTSGGLRIRVKLLYPGHEDLTPEPFVELASTTMYPAGRSEVTDPRAILTVPATAGTSYTIETKVWAPLFPVPGAEDPNASCRIRQNEYPPG